MPKRPTCRGALKNGQPCNTYAEENGLCRHHQDWVDPATLPAAPEPDDLEPDEPDEPRFYTDGRDALASLATEKPELIRGALERILVAAQGVKHDCKHCGRQNKVDMPNAAPIVAAVKAILEEGLGKQQDTNVDPLRAQAQDILTRLDALADDELDQLTDQELAAALALTKTDQDPAPQEPPKPRHTS